MGIGEIERIWRTGVGVAGKSRARDASSSHACVTRSTRTHNGNDSAAAGVGNARAVTRAWQDEVDAEANDGHTLKSRNATTPAGGISSVDNVRTAEYLLDDVEKNLGQMLPDVSPTFTSRLFPSPMLYNFAFASKVFNLTSKFRRLNREYLYTRDFSHFSRINYKRDNF